MNGTGSEDLHAICKLLVQPSLADLAAQLAERAELTDVERRAVHDAVSAMLDERVFGRVIRVLLLELHAARVTGQLSAPDSAGRWQEWVTQAQRPGFWESLAGRYPTLLPRLRTSIRHACAAALAFADRFAADRAALAALVGGEPVLSAVTFGAGDSHRGGQTVAKVQLTDGRQLIYKPRSMRIDAVLERFLARVLDDEPADTRIRVPRVLDRGAYGWAEQIQHRFCTDDSELRIYYRNLGHWLAVTRLLRGSDLHSENLIAAGPVPVVVDCETLFTPKPTVPASGNGQAFDHAAELVRGTVLRTGLLPGRAGMLAFRGVDISAAGGLPGEQPEVELPVVVDGGTDQARVEIVKVEREGLPNHHPSPVPRLMEFWPEVVRGYDELTERLTMLDQSGQLATWLAEFASCQVRLVLRDTVIYSELGTMLWHPASLHNEPTARQRAATLLTRHANNSGAPDDPKVINAEIEDLLVGDVPFYSVNLGTGLVIGPGDITVDSRGDLVEAALQQWRSLPPGLDREVIESAVASAYQDDRDHSEAARLAPTAVTTEALDHRRRAAAAAIVRSLVEHAIDGADGTVSWISPVIGMNGLGIQPLVLDMYGGLPGVAVLLTAYRREVAAGRADPVAGVDDLDARVLRSLITMDDRAHEVWQEHSNARPDPPGGYIGAGSRVWSWLLLTRLGAIPLADGLRRAAAVAALIPEAVEADEAHEVLGGAAGAIVPLLRLAELTGDPRWQQEAVRIGDRLANLARPAPTGVRWPGARSADGIGGFAHGALGIAWALARLADSTGQERFAELAEAGLQFQDSFYDRSAGGWQDLRKEPGTYSNNWCYGSDGIAVVASDLPPDRFPYRHELLSRAAAATWAGSFGSTHTLCHGDMGAWEAMDRAFAAGAAPSDVTREALDARVVSSLTEFGPHWAVSSRMFRPGLMAGAGGIAYQLLRMHRGSELPSLLLPDPAA